MTIEKRSIGKCILLTIVTCGIYSIYWAFKMARECANVNGKDGDTASEILIILFPFIGFFLAEKNLTEGCNAKGIPHKDNTILYLVLGLFGLAIVDFIMLQSDLNNLPDNLDAQQTAYAPSYTPSYTPEAAPIVEEVPFADVATPEAPAAEEAPAVTDDALKDALKNLGE